MYPTKPLGEICEILLGGTPSRNEKEFWGGKNLWCSIADMKEKIIFDTKEKITEKGIQNSNVKLLEEGTLFMSFKLSLGKLAFAGEKLYTNEAIAGLSIKNTKEIDKYFLYYFLLGYNFFKNGTDNSVKGATLNKEKLKQIQISLPPLPTQQKIVEKLDEIFAKIDKNIELTKQNIANIEEENNSLLEGIFSDCEKEFGCEKLEEVCNFVRGPFGGSLKKEIFKPSGYAIYEQQHAINNQFSEIRYFIDENKFNEMKRFELKAGDLIMSCSGTMGKIAIVPKNIKPGIINQALLKITTFEKIFTKFLILYIQSPIFQKILENFSQGATIKNVASVSILKQIQIPLPPLPIQQEIVEKLDKIFAKNSELKVLYEKNLKNLENLKQSILKQAFEDENFIQ